MFASTPIETPKRQTVVTRMRKLSEGVTDEASNVPLSSFSTIFAVLRFRAHMTEKTKYIVTIDARGKYNSISYGRLYSKALKIAQMLSAKLSVGSRVALLYGRNEVIEYAASMFGCFYAGMVAVPIVTDEIKRMDGIISETGLSVALTTDLTLKHIKETLSRDRPLNSIEWWKTNEFAAYHPSKKGFEVSHFY
jgi:acyl-CoA synthetase (AMP-forming)/AMP-acid ligase II